MKWVWDYGDLVCQFGVQNRSFQVKVRTIHHQPSPFTSALLLHVPHIIKIKLQRAALTGQRPRKAGLYV